MLTTKLDIVRLVYNDMCVGYRLYEKDGNVYDVSKDIGEVYNLYDLSDNDIVLLYRDSLLISEDEINNNYIVKDITKDETTLVSLLGVADDSMECMDISDDVDEDATDYVDNIDDIYDEEDEEDSVLNQIVLKLCTIYLVPSRLTKIGDIEGVPVNLDIEIGNELRRTGSTLNKDIVSLSIISKMYKKGYVYKSNADFNNGITDGTFIKMQ